MFSTMEMFQSIFQAVTGFMINWHLDRVGYVNEGTQPPEGTPLLLSFYYLFYRQIIKNYIIF